MVIRGERVWLGGQFVKASLKIENGRILKVGRYEDGEQWAKKEGLIDCGRDCLIPGLIDIHTHGAFGFDTDDGLRDGLKQWAGKLPLEGVTAFLPTTAAQTPAVLKTALENVSAGIRAQEKEKRSPAWPGAQILGVHMEGPFLSRDYAGAQAGNSIALPSIEQFQEYQKAAGGRIRCLTLAPEEDGDFALTRYCSESGVVVSMGHSAADYETALLATANGASSMTHVFNAMTGFHHRRPGLTGAALRIPDLYGEIICDGLHCHPSALNAFFAAKGKNFGIMVTDSLSVKGCPVGTEGRLGGQPVVMREDGLARLKDSQTIAGSTLSMNQGLKLLVEEAMVPFECALNACTINPARLLGIERQKGQIMAGCDADLVLLGAEYKVKRVWCRGEEMVRN